MPAVLVKRSDLLELSVADPVTAMTGRDWEAVWVRVSVVIVA